MKVVQTSWFFALLVLVSCVGKEEVETSYSDYSESDFLADIRGEVELNEVAERIFESELAELHSAEVAGVGFVTFVGNSEYHYMLSQSSETRALDLVLKMPQEDEDMEMIEIIWPLEWAGRSFEEFSASKLSKLASE